MATGYIVWDKRTKTVVSGPYLDTASADTALRDAYGKKAHIAGVTSANQADLSRESVTI
jgi:hypothetical protein